MTGCRRVRASFASDAIGVFFLRNVDGFLCKGQTCCCGLDGHRVIASAAATTARTGPATWPRVCQEADLFWAKGLDQWIYAAVVAAAEAITL